MRLLRRKEKGWAKIGSWRLVTFAALIVRGVSFAYDSPVSIRSESSLCFRPFLRIFIHAGVVR